MKMIVRKRIQLRPSLFWSYSPFLSHREVGLCGTLHKINKGVDLSSVGGGAVLVVD